MQPPVRHPYIPENKGEMIDYLALLMLSSPTFHDDYFPYRNVETVFYSLNAGLENLRPKIGEVKFTALLSLSHQIRQHFESDPHSSNGNTVKGRELVLEMEKLLRSRS